MQEASQEVKDPEVVPEDASEVVPEEVPPVVEADKIADAVKVEAIDD